jgi:hypothetical protein
MLGCPHAGSPVGVYTGLHPGAVINAYYNGPRLPGGVACILSAGSGPSHLLTAGHLFPKFRDSSINRKHIPVLCAYSADQPEKTIGYPIWNYLIPTWAYSAPVDVSLIELTGEGIAMVENSRNWTGWPSLQYAGDTRQLSNHSAVAFLPTAHRWSHEGSATRVADSYDIDARNFPIGMIYTVSNVIAVNPCLTNPADSGTLLSSGFDVTVGLGSCVGICGGFSLFEPMDRSIALVSKHINHQLIVWGG